MKKSCVLMLHVCVAVLLVFSGNALAASLSHTWDFNTTCYGTGACDELTGPFGNERTATSDNGLEVSIRAFAFTSTDGTGPSVAGWLGQYLFSNGGLGVTNSSGDNSHTVDNIGYADYVVFEFSSPVVVASYYMSIFGDADSTWYVGNLAPGFNFTGKTLAQVNALGLATGQNFWSSGASGLETISAGVSGNYLILAAQLDTNDTDDKFKLRTITATQNDIGALPEPGTVVLVGSGLVLLGLVARKRANKLKL